MRHTFIPIICLFMSVVTEVNAMKWNTVQLHVNKIEANRGGIISIYIFLEDGFPVKHDKAIKHYSTETIDSKQSIKIEVPEVPFAIKIHHDEDASGNVTKNWTGFIPAEGLGFSSGAKLGFGPPDFEDAVMTLPETGQVSISIIYP